MPRLEKKKEKHIHTPFSMSSKASERGDDGWTTQEEEIEIEEMQAVEARRTKSVARETEKGNAEPA